MWKLPSLILTELVLGKKVSIIYGLGIGLPLLVVISLVFIWEFLQIPIFYFIFDKASIKIKFLERFKNRMIERTKKQKIFIKLKKYGLVGVALLAIYPFIGGGTLSSVLLANILRLNKKKVYLIISICIIISLLILAGISIPIIKLIR